MELAKLGGCAEKLSLENSRNLADAAEGSKSEEVQAEMLESFARKLLLNLVETPQAASKLLNERFWDLV